MRASVELCPGRYNIEWEYSVIASVWTPLDRSAPVGSGSFSVTEMGMSNRVVTGIFNALDPLLYEKGTMTTVVNVTSSGWIKFARYTPTISIPAVVGGGGKDSEPMAGIMGRLTILHVSKVR
jgi:hypothetical protein